VTSLNAELGPKRLELLRETMPSAPLMALLLNPTNFAVEPQSKAYQAAARILGLQLTLLYASSERELETAFSTVSETGAAALVIGSDTFFNIQSEALAAMTIRHKTPAVSPYRPFAAAGGLMSYGGNFTEPYRNVGVYVGRILKGERSGDLPVQQATKVQLTLNMKTSRVLGLTFPLPLLGRADEVIE
jgi:putative ABC transport system substrate-binding protein